MTEGRNTGFKKILDALEANGSSKPEYETDEDRSYLYMRNLRLFLLKSKKGAERKQPILASLAENSMMTQTQLMDEMNLTRKKVQKVMRELQMEGVLLR